MLIENAIILKAIVIIDLFPIVKIQLCSYYNCLESNICEVYYDVYQHSNDLSKHIFEYFFGTILRVNGF